MSTLWVFGHSICLPFNLTDCTGWSDLLSKKLNVNCVNLAEPGADNFYIYDSFLKNKDSIKENDIVVIGWSHYSRKSFVLDRTNPAQTAVIDNSLLYKSKNTEFIRSNSATRVPSAWLTLTPINRGVSYYDIWFENYYSAQEQKTNFQGYLDSVLLNSINSKFRYLPFYFGKESVDDIDISNCCHAGFMTEFIVDHKLQISKYDLHLSKHGHTIWADYLLDQLTTT